MESHWNCSLLGCIWSCSNRLTMPFYRDNDIEVVIIIINHQQIFLLGKLAKNIEKEIEFSFDEVIWSGRKI